MFIAPAPVVTQLHYSTNLRQYLSLTTINPKMQNKYLQKLKDIG